MDESHKIKPLIMKMGDLVFRENDLADGNMYFIFSGDVAISKKGFGQIRSLSQGHFFGEMALVKAIPRTATATVASATAKIGVIDRSTFAYLARSNPNFLSNLLSVVAKRAIRTIDRIEAKFV